MTQDSSRSDHPATISRRRLVERSAVTLGAFAGIGLIGNQLVSASESTPPASPSSSPAASPASGSEIMVDTVELKFEPNELTIAADTEVKIKITNKGLLQHDFHVDKLNITSKMLNPKDSDTVTVKAAAGTYDFWCTVPGHKEAGMTGKLTVK